tara:strand:+ start:1613 stop:4306 length:2694 start_codon:yes stop_codon:yes gene_type:complete
MKFRLPPQLLRKQAPPSTTSTTPYTSYPLKVGSSLGHYSIDEVISQTQSGYTYLANNRSIVVEEYFPKDIAIRDVDGASLLLHNKDNIVAYEKGLSQFLLLARVLSQIEHPGRVIHYQEENGTAWYATEISVLASFGDLLNTGKRLPEKSLVSIFYAAIEYCYAPHNNAILHLDLGPQQILLLSEEEVILCGFNVAKSSGVSEIERNRPYYHAPEQLHLAGRLGPWSDLYSLGALLYHGLSKHSPPSAGRRYTSTQLGHEDPLIPAAKVGAGLYSQDFLELVDVMLMMSTGDRPSDINHFLEESETSDAPLNDDREDIAHKNHYDLRTPTYVNDLDPNAFAHQANSEELTTTVLSNEEGKHRPTSNKVADALADTAKILEPADTANLWANREKRDRDAVEPLVHSNPKLAPIGANALNDRHFWRQLLRPSSLSARTGDFIGRSTGDVMSGHSFTNRKLKNSRRDSIQIHKKSRIGWTISFFLLLLTSLTGIWYVYQIKATTDIQPTRIQIISERESESLNPLTSHTAQIEDITAIVVKQVQSYLDRGNLSSASDLISLLRKTNISREQINQLYNELTLLEDRERQTELHENLSEEEQLIQQTTRNRTVDNLLKQATAAYKRGELLKPIGSNALTLYRAALDLDRGNQRARNGINSIMYHYIEKTRNAIQNGDYDNAETYLRNAAIVDPRDSSIDILSEQLTARRLWSQRETLRLANIAAREKEEQVAAQRAMMANLSNGIKAYYRGDYLKAYSFLVPLAESGIARAQVRVGTMLLYGRGVAKNNQAAKLWLSSALSSIQLAAARGESWAQSDYGDYFADGAVLKKDYGQAVVWYRRAADQGYPPAQANLGIMYMHGNGVTPDWDKAIDWFRTAASRGNYAAQENLRLLDIWPSDAGG